MAESPLRKRRKIHLNVADKQSILNTFKVYKLQQPNCTKTQAVQSTAEAIGKIVNTIT